MRFLIRARCQMACSRAYTLIELMIVVALLGLAGALLVPRLVAGESLRVQAAVRLLIGDLSFAQSDALANQEIRRVHFYDDGSGYCIVRATSADYDQDWGTIGSPDYISDPLAGSGELGRYIVNFPDDSRYHDVLISDVQIDGDPAGAEGDIVYDSLGGTLQSGGVPGSGGFVEITAGTYTFTLTVAPFTGKLTVASSP